MYKAKIFLVTAIHQFHQVEKAIEHFKLEKEKKILFIIDTNFNVDVLYEKAKKYNIECFYFKNWIFKDLFGKEKEFRRFIRKAKELKMGGGEFDLYMSQYSSDFVFILNSLLKPSIFTLMDEGTAILNFRRIREEEKSSQNFKSYVKSFVYGINMTAPKTVRYFTKYNLKIKKVEDSIEKYTEKKIDNETRFNPDQMVFLGSKLSEVGYVEESDYIDFLNKMVSKYENMKLIYIPHRAESKNKLEKIKSLGFKVNLLGIPFEDWLSIQDSAPGIVSSHFYASSLGNICENFQQIPKLVGFTNSFFNNGGNDKVRSDIFNYLKGLEKIKFVEL